MASAGPNFPSLAVDNGSIGTIVWNNPGNVTAEDGSSASISLLSGSQVFHYIWATNFGFSIPAGATIDGVLAEVKLNADVVGGSLANDNSVKLIKDASLVGDDKADETAYTGTLTYKQYGGATDKWNAGLTADNVNNNNFGLAFSAKKTSTTGGYTVRVDAIRLTVYYTESDGSQQSDVKELGFGIIETTTGGFQILRYSKVK